MRHLLILSSLLLAFSCSYKNQTLDLHISPKGEFSKDAQGSNVFVTVFDYRDNTKIIGTKNYYQESIELSSSKPLPDLLEGSINKTLETHGFELDQNRRYIDLHILKLDYNSKKGIFVGSSSGELKIQAVIKNYNQTKIFEKTFNLSLNRKHVVVSHLSTDQKTIESLLTETVEEILKDESIKEHIIK
jgi:uncharacterized lipoprotein YajG